MNLKVLKNKEELSEQMAAWMADYIRSTLQSAERFSLVLSGGSTPRQLYQLLAIDYQEKIDWTRLHFFWGDERYVPFEDERNNARMAFDSLLDHVPAVKTQIHIMRTDIDPQIAAIEYENSLRGFFPDGDKTFDLVLLGMGSDAHVLSLFPGYELVNETKKWVSSFYSESLKIYRITLTPPVVNAAARIAFLVSGSDKADALTKVLSEKQDPVLYPSQIIRPVNGELYFWVDEDAAANIGSSLK
jgi:6-phosphogluconolactonase